MSDEPYWETYKQWERQQVRYPYHSIYRATDEEKKRMRRKHLWVVFDRRNEEKINYFPSREKAARFWALSR